MRKKGYSIRRIISLCVIAALLVPARNGIAGMIQGTIFDPGMILLEGAVDEGTRWDGVLDNVGRRIIFIRAFDGAEKVAEVNPEADGSFRFTDIARISHITIEVSGCGFFLHADGPWSGDSRVKIDLSASSLFVLDGYVKNIDGSPQQWEMVRAYDGDKRQNVFTYTRSNGHFRFRTNRPVASLQSSADGQKVFRKGPWTKNASVLLEMQRETLFTVSGTVRDEKGTTLPRMRVMAYDADDKNLTSAMTDTHGKYSLTTDRPIGAFRVYLKDGRKVLVRGHWDSDNTVDLRFEN